MEEEGKFDQVSRYYDSCCICGFKLKSKGVSCWGGDGIIGGLRKASSR